MAPTALDQAPCVSFHAALAHELDAAAFAGVQARVRTRALRSFVKRGLIDKDDAAGMRAWAHDGGFSVDGSVRIERAPTGRGSNVCCGIGPVRLSRLRICTNAMPCIWSTAIPSRWAQWRPAHARRRWC